MSNQISQEFARKLMSNVKKLDEAIGKLDSLYSRCEQSRVDEIKIELKEVIGELMAISFDFVGPIVREHRELDPDRV